MLSWNNRRLPQLHARLARRDVRCSEYPDHKTRKQYRIFAEHGLVNYQEDPENVG